MANDREPRIVAWVNETVRVTLCELCGHRVVRVHVTSGWRRGRCVGCRPCGDLQPTRAEARLLE